MEKGRMLARLQKWISKNMTEIWEEGPIRYLMRHEWLEVLVSVVVSVLASILAIYLIIILSEAGYIPKPRRL